MKKETPIKNSMEQRAEKERLMHQGVDSRAMFATFVRKLPVLLLLAVAGAVLGSGLNLLITLAETRDVIYVSETEYYIAFAEGRYEAKDYYNDFTWNDVLATDLILGRAMELLGDSYDRNQVQQMITADILSDVRYLTITVKGHEPHEVEAVKNTLCTALEEFGAKMEEFDSIYQIEDMGIIQEKVQYFAWRAAFLGAVIAAGVGIFAAAFRVCMGSAFYTKSDFTKVFGLPVYGMTFQKENKKGSKDAFIQKQTKMLEKNLKMLTERYSKIILMDASGGQYAEAFLQKLEQCGEIDRSGFCVYSKEQELLDAALLAVIPFGKTYREKIADEMDYVRLQGGMIAGAVLVDADRYWTKVYYAVKL